MDRKHKLFMLLISIGIFLFIYPYTKEVKQFSAADVTWALLKSPKSVKTFNPEHFSFEKKVDYSKKIENLNGKKISILGFVKKEKHLEHEHLLLTETVTHVCAVCNHDEHYGAVVLHPENNTFENLPDDAYIKISGTFRYDTTKHLFYHIDNPVLDTVLILNNHNR